MSELYKFESAADHMPVFLQEVYALAKAIKADPVNRAHVEPVLGLSGCVNRAVANANVGPFGASSEPAPFTLEECCDRLVAICEAPQDGYAAGGALWALMAPLLVRLLDRLLDRVI